MIVRYALSGPEGSIPVGRARAVMPFKVSPSESHPFLKLGDYFKATKHFLLREKAGPLKQAIHDASGRRDFLPDIEKIVVSSEKHGALYHIARADVHYSGTRTSFAVSTALSDQAKERLLHEFDTLAVLRKSPGFSCLPEVYTIAEVICRTHGGEATMCMMLSEWFDDYHEWHFVPDREGEGGRICLWIMNRGHRILTHAETCEIIRRSSLILTLAYDMRQFRHITPWHHAAGDFIVRFNKGQIDVRLTTARGYEPIMAFCDEGAINPVMALITFFLNMTVKMRLDKEQGTGRVIWAEKGILSAVIQGFFEGLRIKEEEGAFHLGKRGEFQALLKAFSGHEMEKLLNALLELYAGGDPADFSVIRQHLSPHAADLRQALQDFHE